MNLTPEWWNRVQELFDGAMHCPADERDTWLRRVCPDDGELRAEVASLLARDAAATDFLEFPALMTLQRSFAECGTSSETALELDRIDSYRILRPLGGGGMGVVYLARQDNPPRNVALKIVHPNWVMKTTIERFQQEIRFAGSLQHPCIAQIYDAGTAVTPHGNLPYYVMEYVHGETLIDFARLNDLPVQSRIELLARICDAVQYAHQRGIIHCDLKPANILVTEPGDPKIIDFGVARALEQNVTHRTGGAGESGQLQSGTPLYMSPELRAIHRTSPDARADTYALGIIAGQFIPLMDSQRAMEAADGTHHPMQIRMPRAWRHDLRAIFQRATAVNPDDRYPAVSDLATDLRNVIASRPVHARPHSASYVARRFARRNHGICIALALTIVMICIAVAGAGFGFAAERRRHADAEQRAREATILSDFLSEILIAVRPEELGRDVLLRDVLDHAARELIRFEDVEPTVRGRLHRDLGATYRQLGDYDKARPHLESALELASEHLGPDDPRTLMCVNSLAVLETEAGHYDVAEMLAHDALDRTRRTLGEEHERTLNYWETHLAVLFKKKQIDEIAELLPIALDASERARGADDPGTLHLLNMLGELHMARGEYEDAERVHSDALELRQRVLGEDHRSTLSSMNNLASVYIETGRYDDAKALHAEVLEHAARALGAHHPFTLTSQNNLALTAYERGDFATAEIGFRAAFEGRSIVLGPTHPSTERSLRNLAASVLQQRRADDAIDLYLELLDLCSNLRGEMHLDTAWVQRTLADIYVVRNVPADALRYSTPALETAERLLPPDDRRLAQYMVTHGCALRSMREFEEAGDMLHRAYELLSASLGEDHMLTRRAAVELERLRKSRASIHDASP